MEQNTDHNENKVMYRYGNLSIEKYQQAWVNFFKARKDGDAICDKMRSITDEIKALPEKEDRRILTFQKAPEVTKLHNSLMFAKVAIYQCGDRLGLNNKDYFIEN